MRQIYKFGLNPPRFLKISFTFPAKLHFKSSGRLPAILQRPFPTWETFLQFCSGSSRFGKPSRSFATALPDLGNLPAILQRLFPIRETFLQFCSSPSRFGKPSRSFTASLPRPRKPSRNFAATLPRPRKSSCNFAASLPEFIIRLFYGNPPNSVGYSINFPYICQQTNFI